jgi:uncharacterized protein
MSRFRKNQDQDDLWIKLDEIKESGYHLSCSRNKDWIENTVSDIESIDFTFIDGVRIQLEVSRSERSFFISGLISTIISINCIRCLDDFDYPLEAEFRYTLYPSDESKVSPEMEINREDLDLLYYQGDGIDIAPLVREQILLNVPSCPQCRESCEGICSQCGSNLNQGPCQCAKQEKVISKFEILKHFPVKH